MILLPVPPEELDAHWPFVLPFAEKMAERFPDDWPVHETLRQARGNVLRLWLAHDQGSGGFVAAAGTKIILKPSGRLFLVIRWMAGEIEAAPLIAGLEQYGRAQGCSVIEIEPGSRGGWAKAFPDYRARPTVMLTKELSQVL